MASFCLSISELGFTTHLFAVRVAWRLYSLPLLVCLGHHSSSTSRDIRHNAMSQLQRILLGPYVTASDRDHAQVDEMFNRVVFPLLDELLKPDVLQRDPHGMPETRLRASALLCKVFLHFEMRLSQSKLDIRILWIQILDLLDRFMNIDRRDQLVCPFLILYQNSFMFLFVV